VGPGAAPLTPRAAKGAQKAKPVVGEGAAGMGASMATEKGSAGVDKGVDKAAEKVEGKLK
jgi:hypothetical protein